MKYRLLLLSKHHELANEFERDIICDEMAFEWKSLDINQSNLDPRQYDLFLLSLDESEQKNKENLLYLRSMTEKVILVLLEGNSEILESYFLELGADGIINLPLRKIETCSRLKAIFRRLTMMNQSLSSMSFQIGSCLYDTNEHRLVCDGKEVELTMKESDLLNLLIRNKNHVVNRDVIFRTLYPLDKSASDNALNILVNRLRKKIEVTGLSNTISTVSGYGYRYNSNEIKEI
jgi:DNA-binding response OmpR family regulator